MGNHSHRMIARRTGPLGTPPTAARDEPSTDRASHNGRARTGAYRVCTDGPGIQQPWAGGHRTVLAWWDSHALWKRQGSRAGRPRRRRRRAASRPDAGCGATGGRGIGGRIPASLKGARVVRGLPVENLAGLCRNADPSARRDRCSCSCRSGLTRARARQMTRSCRRSRPGGRALARQSGPALHEFGS